MTHDNNSVLNDLLEKSYYVIDFLPRQVPRDADGQFFRIENYLLNNYERYGLRDRFIRTILKLMCYYRVTVHWGEWLEQPAPEQIAEIVDTIMENHSGFMNMLFPGKNALLVLEWGLPESYALQPGCRVDSTCGADSAIRGLVFPETRGVKYGFDKPFAVGRFVYGI